MSAKVEVESHIRENWRDPKVAEWVIRNLPLLEHSFSHPQCPIYILDLEKGLTQINTATSPFLNITDRQKVVISGGFEGSSGQIQAVKYLEEIAKLDKELWDAVTLVMLEPDSYIRKVKHREPLVNIQQRCALWSTTGLAQAVILLPEPDPEIDVDEHYQKIHRAIAPAVWSTNYENPHWREIIMRHRADVIEGGHLYINEPIPHTSFLCSTRDLSVEDVLKELRVYIENQVRDGAGRFNIPPGFSESFYQEQLEVSYKIVCEGL